MSTEPFRLKRVYNLREAASLCGLSPEVLLDQARSGILPAFQIPGGHLRVLVEDLQKFILETGKTSPLDGNAPKQPFRVLIVEDDPDLLEIFTELLHDEPEIEVRAENNGFTAGFQIAGWRPDLILLDFLMPRISGFEICGKLRAQPETQDIPVLALTALNSEEDKKAIFEAGASDYLGKPFRSSELIQKVRSLLGLDRISF